MKKIVSYLMLVLCLFLFPFRVRGLEIEEADNNEVIEEKIDEIENLDDLVQAEDPEEVLRNNTSNNVTSDEEPSDEELAEEEPAEDVVATRNTRNANNLETPAANNIELSQIDITGVVDEFVGGEPFTFGGASSEPDKYSVVREAWITYGESINISTSDDAYNNALPEEYTYVASPEADQYYHYQLVISLEDGYVLSPEYTLTINGSECNAYTSNSIEDPSIYIISTDFSVQAKNAAKIYIDSLDIVDAVTEAYIDQAPLYGARTETDHFSIFGELWTRVVETINENEYEYSVYTNASDPSLMDEYEIFFDKFEEGKNYSYIIVADAEAGYRLAYTSGTNYNQNYPITINGNNYDCEVDGYQLDENTYRYFILVLETTPRAAETYEITENADPVVTEGEISDVSMTVDAPNDELEAVYVDGKIVSEDSFTAEENTMLTLLANFLNTLGQGVHSITMRFATGKFANTTITIEGKTSEVAATPLSGQNTSYVAAEYTVQTIATEEKPVDHKLEVKEKEVEEETSTEEENNTALIVFLVILILIAIIIPVTIYHKNND